jgi:hypothetical protein
LRHLVWLRIERVLSAAVQNDVEAESSGPSDRWSRDPDWWTASAVAVNAPGVPRRVSKAARAAAPEGGGEAAGRLECQWQRDQLPGAIRELVLDDQRLRNDICWSVFDC